MLSRARMSLRSASSSLSRGGSVRTWRSVRRTLPTSKLNEARKLGAPVVLDEALPALARSSAGARVGASPQMSSVDPPPMSKTVTGPRTSRPLKAPRNVSSASRCPLMTSSGAPMSSAARAMKASPP